MDWIDWIGKRVYVELFTSQKYTGKVTAVNEQGNNIFIVMIDKFNSQVIFSTRQVALIKEDCKGEVRK